MSARFLGFLCRLSRLGRRVRLFYGPAGQAVAVLLAFALPLALSGAGSNRGQVRWPSPTAAGSAVLRLVDWVTGRQVPVPKGPAQRFGSAPAGQGQVPAAVTRAVARAAGGPAGQGRGQVPAWSRPTPARQEFTTGKAPGTGGYDAATSTVDEAGSTATSVLYKNADGSYSRQVFPYPVNYRTAAGSWARIDPTLAAGKGGRWQGKANSIAVSFAPKADSASLASVAATDAAGSALGVSLGLAGAAAVTGTADGASVRYSGVLKDTDLTATDSATGASEDLVLRSASAPSSWVFPLTLHGLTAQAKPDGSVDLVDSSGQVAVVIPEGLARDSASAGAGAGPDSGATVPVPWQVVSWNGGTALAGSVSAAWLADPARVFPVTVDPTESYPNETGSTYVMNPFTADYSGDTLMKVGNDGSTYNGSQEYARSFLAFNGLGSSLANQHITAATLYLWDAWAWTCSTPEPFEADAITASWSVSGNKSWPGPAIGTKMGTSNDVAPAAACTNTAGDPTVGGWMKVPMTSDGLSVLNDWTLHPADDHGIAVSAYIGSAYTAQWKQFDSFNTPNLPHLWIDYTPDVAPQVDGQYPPDGYGSPTLTPELIASGSDSDNWPDPLQYVFTVYTSSGTKVGSSGLISSMDWTVPKGDLSWGQTYYWTVQDYDGLSYSGGTPTPQYFSTNVPQPLVTSALSQNSSAAGYDAASGNWTTSATDAKVATVGPALEITRDYNSFDPRQDGAFGAGWSSVLDAGVSPGQTDSSHGTATEVVTYPDGQQVAFGLNADGSYTPPQGRFAQLRGVSGGGFTLTDKSDTVYTFTHSLGSGSWGITSIADAIGRSVTFDWVSGQIKTMTSSASGRALHVSWAGTPAHVASVTTDDVTPGDASTALTWGYTYSGNQLTKVCAPQDPQLGAMPCTQYSYTAGSDYPESVLDSGPHSYWRLNESSGTAAASAVLVNEGTDNATYSNVQLASSAGPLAGSSQRSPDFDGTSSYIALPPSLVNHAAYMSVSLWFRTTITGDGVLFSYQGDPVTNGTTTGGFTPAIYLGTDHKLHAQFWDNDLNPMATTGTVNDGNWHLVTLTAAGNSQVLYLDGVQQATKSGTVKVQGEQHDYLGAGFLGGAWPYEDHQGVSTGYETVFRGYLSDAALWDRSLTAGEVAAMYAAGTQAAALATKVTRPSGKTYETAGYDAVTGRVTSVTDPSGGTWGIGAPTVTGSSQVYRSAVLGAGPLDYWRLNDTGTVNPQNQVIGGTAVNNSVTQGNDGPFPDSSGYHFNGTSSYIQLPSGLVRAGNESVSLWFRTQVKGDVLLSSSATPITNPSAGGDLTPELYVGSDGKLNAEFWNNTIDPMTTKVAVTDGQWHNVILSAGAADERLYLDGQLQATMTGTITLGSGQVYDYLGAGFIGGSWPDQPNSGSNPAPRSYYTGNIGEVSFFYSEVGNERATDLWNAASQSTGKAPYELVSVTDPGTKTITYTYDPANGDRILSQTDALGKRTSYGYDIRGFLNTVVHPNGDTTVTGHDVRGNEVSQTTCQDQAALKCSTTYSSYYPDDTSADPPADPRNDLILTSSDGRSASASDTTYRTSYAYDAAGDLTSKTTPPVPGAAAGLTTSYAYTLPGNNYGGYNGAIPPPGLRYKVTTPAGAVTRTLYDAQGNVVQVTDPDGLVTTYAYDGLGRVTSKAVTSDAYPNGLVTSYAYNPQGQVVTETDPAVTDRVTGAEHTAKVTTAYDLDGNVTSRQTSDLSGGDAPRTVSWTYTGFDQKQTYTDAYGATTTYTYDPYGNLTQVQQPGGGVVTDYTYDPDRRLLLTKLENYAGAMPGSCQTASPSLIESSRSYDPDGRLASVTDAMCDVTSYGYTDNGLVATVTRSDGGGSSYTDQASTYDRAGNLIEQVTGNGATTTDYTVDAAGRVTSKTLDPGGLDRVTSYTYTPDGKVASEQLAVGSGSPVRSTSYGYDPAGNETSQSVAVPGAGGPAAWWPLNETSGTSAADSSGNGFTAAATGVTWAGGGASFDGTAGEQITTRGPVLDTTRSFTVAAWVNLAGNTSANQTVISQDAGTDSGFYLKYFPDTSGWQFMRPLTDTASPATVNAGGPANATVGTWTFLAGTYDVNTGTMTLYVNGTAVGATGTDATPVPASGPLAIGRAKWNGNQGVYFDGQIADVQVYQRALSAGEVSSLYGLGRGGGKVTTGALATTWTRDQRGLPTSMTSPDGDVTRYVYDEAGRLAVTEAPQTVPYVNGQPSLPAAAVTSTGYDTFGETAETEDPDGNETTYAYSSNQTGRVVTVTPPGYTQPGASAPLPAADTATTVQYNGLGQVVSRTTPAGPAGYTYDQLGDITSVTPPGTSATTYTYYPSGKQASQSGPAGSTSATYDYLGRQVTFTQAETKDGPGSYTTGYSYAASAADPGGAWLSSVTTPRGVSTSYTYDAAGEATAVTDGETNTTSYTYDAAGDKTSVTYPAGPAGDSGTRTTYSFDAAGRRTGSADLSAPDGSGNRSVLRQESAAYDGEGNLVSSTDYQGNATTFTYDAAGRVTAEVQPVTAAAGVTVSFAYDLAGNQTRYTDGDGNQWQTTWNPWNLPESRIEPATAQYTTPADSTFTTTYDAAGRPLTIAQPGGITVSDSYNAMGLLAGQSGTGAGAATADRSFGYDGAGRLTSAATSNTAPSGQPSNATSESFTYDDRGLLASASGSAGSSSFTWNGDGQVASATTPAGTAGYTYDAAGRPQTMTDPATGTTLTWGYNSLSQPSSVTYGSGGDVRTFTYNAERELSGDSLATGSGAAVASIGYSYDLNGNLTGKATSGFAGTGVNSYAYDQAGRLASWDDGAAVTSYGYDGAGNLTRDGSAVLSYDARGELTSNGSTSYSYTAAGTLAQVSASWGTTAESSDAYGQQAAVASRSYVYDALGRDVQASGNGGATAAFSYLGTGGQVTGDGTATYTWAPDGTLAATGVSGGSPARGVLDWTDAHTDLVGQFTPSGASLAAATDYDPWGNGVAWAGGGSGSLGFQSQYADPVTGLTEMGARWYRASTGGFTSRDTVTVPPVPDPAAASPFGYAGDNPLGFTDPTGHDAIPFVGASMVEEASGPAGYGANLAESELLVGERTVGYEDAVIRAVAETQYPSWQGYARAFERVALAAAAIYAGYEIAGGGGSGAPGASGSTPGSGSGTCPVSPSGYWGGCAPYINDGVDGGGGGGGSTPPWWASYRHAPVHYKIDKAPVAHPHPFSAAAVAAMIRAIARTLALAAAGQGGGGSGGVPPAAPAADGGGCGPGGGPLPSVLGLPGTDGQQQGGQSFTGGTRVLLASGRAVPISSLKPGDKVLATNVKTGKTQAEPVTAVLVHRDTDLYDLKVKAGRKAGVIHTTASHLFWDPYPHYGWIPANHLKPGDHLKTPDGQSAVVVGGSTPAVHDGWMWDLTVPGNNDHDFYVVAGATPVLVHNSDGCVTVSDGVTDHIFGQHGWGGAYHETALTADDSAVAAKAMGNVFAKGISREDLQGMIQDAIDNGTRVARSSSDPREGYYIQYDFGGYETVGANGQNGIRLAVDGNGNLTTAMPIWMTGGAG